MPIVPPTEENLQMAARLLQKGALVAFPTETVYGLGANALNPEAVAKIYAAKGRPSRNPLIVHVADKKKAISGVAAVWTDTADRLAEAFWPGGLTLVLPRRPEISRLVTGGGETVGIRVPLHPLARRLLDLAGVPVAAPSANRSLSISPTQAIHVEKSLGEHAPLILDGGAAPGGVESTVLNLTETPPRLLRPGLISPDRIRAVIGEIVLPDGFSLTPHGGGRGPLPSPGLLSRHYAPNATLRIAENDGAAEVERLLLQGERVGWLTFLSLSPILQSHPNLIPIEMPADAPGYASRLFAALYELDEAAVTRIVAARPPENEAWLAIRDRLQRASAP